MASEPLAPDSAAEARLRRAYEAALSEHATTGTPSEFMPFALDETTPDDVLARLAFPPVFGRSPADGAPRPASLSLTTHTIWTSLALRRSPRFARGLRRLLRDTNSAAMNQALRHLAWLARPQDDTFVRLALRTNSAQRVTAALQGLALAAHHRHLRRRDVALHAEWAALLLRERRFNGLSIAHCACRAAAVALIAELAGPLARRIFQSDECLCPGNRAAIEILSHLEREDANRDSRICPPPALAWRIFESCAQRELPNTSDAQRCAAALALVFTGRSDPARTRREARRLLCTRVAHPDVRRLARRAIAATRHIADADTLLDQWQRGRIVPDSSTRRVLHALDLCNAIIQDGPAGFANTPITHRREAARGLRSLHMPARLRKIATQPTSSSRTSSILARAYDTILHSANTWLSRRKQTA